MIEIKIIKLKKKYYNFIISGHSDFYYKGKDIVCAAITGIVQGMFNAIDKIINPLDVSLKLCPENKVQANISVIKDSNNDLQILLKAFYYQVLTIKLKYPKFINIITNYKED